MTESFMTTGKSLTLNDVRLLKSNEHNSRKDFLAAVVLLKIVMSGGEISLSVFGSFQPDGIAKPIQSAAIQSFR